MIIRHNVVLSCFKSYICSGPKKGGKAADITPGYSLIVYSITEAPPLLHDHKAYEGIVPRERT